MEWFWNEYKLSIHIDIFICWQNEDNTFNVLSVAVNFTNRATEQMLLYATILIMRCINDGRHLICKQASKSI